MAYLIDFDDPRTFPEELRQWDDDFIHKIQNAMNTLDTNLRNLDLQNEAIVSNFVENHADDEVVVYHCTRILDQNEYWHNGIVTGIAGAVQRKAQAAFPVIVGAHSRDQTADFLLLVTGQLPRGHL